MKDAFVIVLFFIVGASCFGWAISIPLGMNIGDLPPIITFGAFAICGAIMWMTALYGIGKIRSRKAKPINCSLCGHKIGEARE